MRKVFGFCVLLMGSQVIGSHGHSLPIDLYSRFCHYPYARIGIIKNTHGFEEVYPPHKLQSPLHSIECSPKEKCPDIANILEDLKIDWKRTMVILSFYEAVGSESYEIKIGTLHTY